MTVAGLLAAPAGGFRLWGLLLIGLLVAWTLQLLGDLAGRTVSRIKNAAAILAPAAVILIAHLFSELPAYGEQAVAGAMNLSFALLLGMLALGSLLAGRLFADTSLPRPRFLLGVILAITPLPEALLAQTATAGVSLSLTMLTGGILCLTDLPASRLLRRIGHAYVCLIGLWLLRSLFLPWPCAVLPPVGWFGVGERALGLLPPLAPGAQTMLILLGWGGSAITLLLLGIAAFSFIRSETGSRRFGLLLAAVVGLLAWIVSPGLAQPAGLLAAMVALGCLSRSSGRPIGLPRALPLVLLVVAMALQAIAPRSGLLRWGTYALGLTDKAEHVLAGAILTLLMIWTFAGRSRRTLWIVAILAALGGPLGEVAQAIFSSRRPELLDATAHLVGWATAVGLWRLACLRPSRYPRATRWIPIGITGILALAWLGGYTWTRLSSEVHWSQALTVSDAVTRPGVDGFYFRGRSGATDHNLDWTFTLLLRQPDRPLRRVYCSGSTVYPLAIKPTNGITPLVIFGNPFGPAPSIRYPLRLGVPRPEQPVLLVTDTPFTKEQFTQLADNDLLVARLATGPLTELAARRDETHDADSRLLCIFNVRQPNDPFTLLSLVLTWNPPAASRPVILLTTDGYLARRALSLKAYPSLQVWLIHARPPAWVSAWGNRVRCFTDPAQVLSAAEVLPLTRPISDTVGPLSPQHTGE